MLDGSQFTTSIYDLEYFSGSQMFLYIGDVWVDEVTSLQYTVQQSKAPIYGYASQLFDDVAKGQVLVQGGFTVNFKEQGYLWTVLRRYKQFSLGSDPFPISDGIQENNPIIKGDRGTLISRASIERLVGGEATNGDRAEFYNELAGYATFNGQKSIRHDTVRRNRTKIEADARDQTFEDIAEAFEDQVWNASGRAGNQGLNSQVRRIDDNRFDDFDIYVVFGDYTNAAANHTVRKIIGVRLLSESKSIVIDGQPIQEQYSFIAQSVA